MELAHGLLLNEEAYKEVSNNKKPTFIYEWLRFLHKVLGAAQKTDIKDKQEKLIDQLTAQILTGPGPPTRQLIGKCLTMVYNVGGSYTSYKTVNKCNEIARNKDDSPSYLQIRLTAIDCLGSLYEDMGQMMGNVMQETIHILTKGLKNAESQTRAATIDTLRRVMVGLRASASICHREIYKVSKNALIDRSMHVRTAAAECLRELGKQATFVYFSEFENLCNQCIRSLEGSSYEVRCSVSKLLGYLAAESQRVRPTTAKEKRMSLVDVLNVLMGGFVQTSSSRSLVNRDKQSSTHSIRIGVTMAYIEMARYSGPQWLERYHSVFIKHVLELVLHPKCTSVHVEAVYSRRCVSFILRSTIGRFLGEKQQRTAARELCNVISQQMNAIDMSSSENSGNGETINNQHMLVCAANELGCIIQSLGTSAAPLVAEAQSNILQPVVAILLHPTQCARLAAAWCLRCIATALPSQLTPLIDKCATSIRNMKSSREAVSGYSSALAALLGAVSESPMGIPHSKGSIVFGVAEELLRTANKNGRLALYKTQAGWILLGALMTLGPSVIRHNLSRLLQLWKSVFPRSMRELEQERQKGDSFTWQLTLEARSGALCAMRSFVANCGELLTDDVTRKLMVPLESAMAMMGIIPYIINTHGLHLKASAAMVRLRLYDILALLPPKSYEGSFHALLRELVAEFTLTDNPANTSTSLLKSLCHQDDSVLLGYWMQDTDQSFIEDQMQTNTVSGSGALEHDATSVYLPAQDNIIPGPLPLGVSVIDAAIALFGLAFSHVAHKHRVQMLRHFGECVKQSVKNPGRQRAIQINVFTALICALKGLSENKLTLGKSEIINAATVLVLEALASTDSVLRCAAGEAVGRMAQVSDEGGFVSKIVLMCFEKLKTARDVISRTGHSLALGCVHRYVGGMGAAQHLRTSVGILLALAQDHNSPEVQVWALHALALIVDAFGPMFRSYVEPTLQAILSLLLHVPLSHANVHRCLGRCLSAIITTLGPELQGTASAISSARSNCLTCCSIMSRQSDAQVQAESISCLQQLHMFAPRHVELSSLVPSLCTLLSSWHLVLRRSAVSCLRQLSQKEAEEVCEIALRLSKTDNEENEFSVQITDNGLEGALFKLLDLETDMRLRSDAKDALNHILQSTALKKLGFWLRLCKSVLASSTDNSALGSVDAQQPNANDDKEDEDDSETFTSGSEINKETKNKILPRWRTRVFAMQSVQKITLLCQQASSNRTHFDLAKARSIIGNKDNHDDFLVLYLSDLVRMAFMAATDNNANLRMVGLDALQDVIKHFKDVPEPEFPGAVILEQYQANVGAALRPAFAINADSSHEVTSRACEVCSAWLASAVVSDLNDLKRVHSLLVTSLDKIESNDGGSLLYSESASTMEKLAVLKAWAEVYIVAMETVQTSSVVLTKQTARKQQDDSLLSLVKPHLTLLSKWWIKALRDHALLRLPREFNDHLPKEGGTFFTHESKVSVRAHFANSWPPIVHAAALWFQQTRSEDEDSKEDNEMTTHLIIGICVETLCSPRSSENADVVIACLSALNAMLSTSQASNIVAKQQVLAVEILNVLHRLLLTRENLISQQIIMQVVKKITEACLAELKDQPDASGEGAEDGLLVAGKSTVFAILEICMCVLVRQFPAINPTFRSKLGFRNKEKSPSKENLSLVSSSIKILLDGLNLCSPKATISVLPTVLILITGVLKEVSKHDKQQDIVALKATILQSLGCIVKSSFMDNNECRDAWVKIFRSTLATLLTSDDNDHAGDVTLLMCASLFLLSSPPTVCKHPVIMKKMLDLFEMCIMSDDSQVFLKCIQILPSIFQNKDEEIAHPFISRLSPKLVAKLLSVSVAQTAYTGVVESFNLLDLLVTMSTEEHREEIVDVLMSVLVSFLCFDEDNSKLPPDCLKMKTSIHNFALQHLIQVGQKHAEQFRNILQQQPHIKTKLEAAIRANQARTQQQQLVDQKEKERLEKIENAKEKRSNPSIKLKMDFSNFSKK